MVLTSQQQSDVKDIIRNTFEDKIILSMLAETVANLVVDKLNEKWNSLQEKVNKVETEVVVLRNENLILKEQLNYLDQQRRRNCIRLLGFEERKGEDLTAIVKKTFLDKLKLQRNDVQIDYCHRMKTNTKRAKPVIVHFSSVQSRDLIFKNKSKLKGTRLVITEDLTKTNYALFKRSMDRMGSRDVWTLNGNVYAKLGARKMLIGSEADLVMLDGEKSGIAEQEEVISS